MTLPTLPNMDLEMLARWKARDHKLPEERTSGRPEGSRRSPRWWCGSTPWAAEASSAGVERMYVQQEAGKLYNDLKASQTDDTLEHALLAGERACSEPDAGGRRCGRAMRDTGTA